VEALTLLLVLLVIIIQLSAVKPGLFACRQHSYVVIDTSALVDGRILSIIDTSFLRGATLVVCQEVIHELQLLADSKDRLTRQRAQHGLELLEKIKRTEEKVIFDNHMKAEDESTDMMLIRVAKKYKGMLFTTDYNLSKIAGIQGIAVLNPNQLAGVLRAIILPGEELEVLIVQKGERRSQGIGYLSDGTMVVVEGAGSKQHQTVKAIADKFIQTDSGKMIFTHRAKKSH
jgi:uncharacterized protein YacL